MLIIVAALLVLLCLFHSIIGERFILQPLKKTDGLPKLWGSQQATFRTIQASWHVVSAMWLGLAMSLVAITVAPEQVSLILLIAFGLIFGALGVVPLVWESGKHKSWIAFFLISGLLLASAYRIWSGV